MSLNTITTKDGVELPAFFDGTTHRVLGLIQTDMPKMAVRPFTELLASNNTPVMDLDKIPEYDRYQSNVPILDQGQVGSCCGHSYTSANMKMRDLAGQTVVPLSADSLYAQVNHGIDQGSDPNDVITALEQNGECILADVPDQWVLWQNIPPTAKETAKRFRIDAGGVYSLSNYAELLTADYLGFATTLTIRVGPNFGPGQDGVVGFWPGVANHCTAGGESVRRVNGQTQYRIRNSWSLQWAINGCAWITQQHIDSQPGVIMHAIMWVPEDSGDPTNIPKAAS